MRFRIFFTCISILSFSSIGLFPNLKAYEKNILSISKDLDNNLKKNIYETKYILGSGDKLDIIFPRLSEFNTTQDMDIDGNNEFYSFKYNPKAQVNKKQNPILMEEDVINVRRTFYRNVTSVTSEIVNPIVTRLSIYRI
tara:strand:+ start:1108 stop:1524 length:417 start_codon:yes stop_codon:yes gene_type:complete